MASGRRRGWTTSTWRLIRPLSVLTLVAGSLVSPIGAADAAVFEVTRLDDPAPDSCAPGDCSLREAVLSANDESGHPGPDTIVLPAGVIELSLAGRDRFKSCETVKQ